MKKVFKKGLFSFIILNILFTCSILMPSKVSASIKYNNDAIDYSSVMENNIYYNTIINSGIVFIPIDVTKVESTIYKNTIVNNTLVNNTKVTLYNNGNICTFTNNKNYCIYNGKNRYLAYECFTYFGQYTGTNSYSYDGYKTIPSNTIRNMYISDKKLMYVPLQILIDMGYKFDISNETLILK